MGVETPCGVVTKPISDVQQTRSGFFEATARTKLLSQLLPRSKRHPKSHGCFSLLLVGAHLDWHPGAPFAEGTKPSCQ